MRKLLVWVWVGVLVPLPAIGGKGPHIQGTPLRSTGFQMMHTLWGADDLVAFDTSERAQGNTDLDGDGDVTGRVFVVYDGESRRAVSTGLAYNLRRLYLAAEPGVIYLNTAEVALDRDVNGDGDLSDGVLHIYDQETGRVLDADWVAAWGFKAGRKVFLPNSSNPFPDADAASITHVFDLDTGEREALGMTFGGLQVIQDAILVSVNDEAAGLRGRYRYDPETGALDPVGLPLTGCSLHLDAELWALYVCGEGADLDLNGDGDINDEIPFLYEVGSHTLTPLPLALADWNRYPYSMVTASEGYLALVVSEQRQGREDLNGDGDVDDRILFTVRLEPGAFEITNTGRTLGVGLLHRDLWQEGPTVALNQKGSGPWPHYGGKLIGIDAEHGLARELADVAAVRWVGVSSEIIAFDLREQVQGDLNGDGDTQDHVTHYWERRRDRVVNTGLAVYSLARVAGQWLAVPTQHCPGLPFGCVVLLDTRSGRRIAHRGGSRIYLSESVFGVSTLEFHEDFNGDGDSSDNVLFVLNLPGRGRD